MAFGDPHQYWWGSVLVIGEADDWNTCGNSAEGACGTPGVALNRNGDIVIGEYSAELRRIILPSAPAVIRLHIDKRAFPSSGSPGSAPFMVAWDVWSGSATIGESHVFDITVINNELTVSVDGVTYGSSMVTPSWTAERGASVYAGRSECSRPECSRPCPHYVLPHPDPPSICLLPLFRTAQAPRFANCFAVSW